MLTMETEHVEFSCFLVMTLAITYICDLVTVWDGV
jgi:hypothetical protein